MATTHRRTVRLTDEHLRILELAKDKLRDASTDSDVFRWMLEEWRDRQEEGSSKDARLTRIERMIALILKRLGRPDNPNVTVRADEIIDAGHRDK